MKCKKHPKYLGIHKPRADCSQCHEIYASELKARELAEEKEKNKSKDAEKYLELKKVFEKVSDLGPFWRDVVIEKPRFSDWKLKASIWLDDGYGGGLTKVEAQSPNLLDGLKTLVREAAEYDKMFSHRYM